MRNLDIAHKLAEKLDALDITATENKLLTVLEQGDQLAAADYAERLRNKLTTALQFAIVIEALITR